MKPILTLLLCLVCASAQADKLVTGNRVDRVRVNNLVSLVLRSALPLRFAKNFGVKRSYRKFSLRRAAEPNLAPFGRLGSYKEPNVSP